MARAVSFAGDDILVAIGAPLGATLGEIHRDFHFRVGVLALVTLVSAVLAHLVVHGLIWRWARRIRDVVEAIGAGRWPGTRSIKKHRALAVSRYSIFLVGDPAVNSRPFSDFALLCALLCVGPSMSGFPCPLTSLAS